MNCPACKDVTLSIAERQGVEIDYCPSCRGVWLDRGELDKILERSESAAGAAPPGAQGPVAADRPRQPPPPQHIDRRKLDDSDFNRPAYDPRYGGYGKKRKSLLRELLDF